MEILIHQRPQIVSGDYSMNFHPFGACDGSLESLNPTLFTHMGLSHFNTSYSIRSCSFLSKIVVLILTGSIASKGIYYLFQDKFKNPKIIKIQQVHQKIHTKQFLLLYLNCLLFVIHLNLKQLTKQTDLVMCQCESHENVKEFVMTSSHVTPCPIVS